MGSIEEACITGFLCRLCSQIHRSVIFIYGAEGDKHKLEQKINNYLPVKIAPSDPLPKTVCEGCMNKVIQHHGMIRKIAETQKKFKKLREEETLIRQQLNRHSVNANQASSTSSAASGSSIRTNSVGSNTSSPITASATLERTGSSSTGSPSLSTPSSNRRITRQTLRIHQQLHNDINNYIETMDSSSPSSDDDSDSDSGDGN
ncbi:AAEL004570-PA [Aedes aegypti]|uniref:AAEL004570-PA n=2 Tax=Aedes aegypti TaxID=7159 RepID=A0A1S4F8B1_AEDAE|nr:uncharacterized protein LOC5565067 [Aedes aegypti]EAT44037.1 AAEL004570-PA [Aedes aegypti]